MARIVKAEEYTARRNEILAVARRRVYTKGFDQMTIQDILDDLRISKGAFYHYFDSKAAVQEALIEQMVNEEVAPLLQAIIHDPGMTALEKLHAYFQTSARWKTENKEMVLSIMRIWYSDENLLFRQKMFAFAFEQITPMLGTVVRQGIREGVFNTAYPDHVGEVLFYFIQGLSDKLVHLLINAEGRDWDDPQVGLWAVDYLAALTDALERMLGAPKGSIHLMDAEMLKVWFVPANGKTEAALLKNGKEQTL